jgi:hypothetical protein
MKKKKEAPKDLDVIIGIRNSNNMVFLDFGETPIKWVGLDEGRTRDLARALIAHADKVAAIRLAEKQQSTQGLKQ